MVSYRILPDVVDCFVSKLISFFKKLNGENQERCFVSKLIRHCIFSWLVVNIHQTANDCSSKDQLLLGSSDRGLEQYTQFHKTYIPRVVGIYMEPSVEYIVSVLSVLRCGEAFMPLDPSWPNERILSVISSSKADLIVGYKSSVDRPCHQLDKLRWLIHKGSYPLFYMSIENVMRKKSDSSLAWPCESERLRSFCYLMYTSGSTGIPKGVCGTEVGELHILENV